MGGGSFCFAGSIASLCMALLNAYCKENKNKNSTIEHFKVYSCQEVDYLCLDLPELGLFSTVHLTVDDQNIWQTSNVACLQLQWHKKTEQHTVTAEFCV